MKAILALGFLFVSQASFSQTTVKMNYKEESILTVIENYSKATGQKFVVDPAVRGKISIFSKEELPQEDAFNQLSSALATNGYGISKQGDTMVVKSARNIQRDYIQTSAEKPSLKPERMYTWIYTVKNIPATSINRDLRVLMSRDGEMSILSTSNQLIFTDWTSNLNRVADLMAEIDKVPTAEAKKLAAEGAKMNPPMGKGPKGPMPPTNFQKNTDDKKITE